jgi:hypothetical protein
MVMSPGPQPGGARRLAVLVVVMLVVIAGLAVLAIWASHNG